MIPTQCHKEYPFCGDKHTDYLLLKAQNDFDKAITGISKKELKQYLPAFGINAMRFAMRYTNPNDDKQLYDKIYNIYFDFFDKLQKESN